MQPKFIYFESYGCVANQNNTEIMKGLVRQSGLEITNNTDIADLLVINTCVVKEPTEKKIERRISELKKLGKPIIIAGCMPEVRADRLKEKNIYLLGTHNIKFLPKLIRKICEGKYEESEFLEFRNEEKLCQPKIAGKNKVGITQISEGCLGNCAYCIVKIAKGKLFSYDKEKILKNIQNDLQSGAKQIWITSQDNASYGLDVGKRKLPELLRKVLDLKGKFEVRVGMMNPENVLPILNELIDIYKHKKMKKFLHIPVQSGSNKILKAMNRKYQIKDFIKIIEKFKKQIPDLFLSTDIIVGFPGETEEDFNQSVELIKKIKPDMLNLSRYWAMKPTSASQMKQIPVKIIKQRASKLMNIYKKSRADKMEIRKISSGIVIKEGNILMIKRRYEPYKGKWCIPGGFTDKSINEAVEDCCKREIKEETGIDVEIIKKIDIIKFYNKIKERDEEIHIFLCKSKNKDIIIDDEVEDAKWLDFDELNNLDLVPGVKEVINKASR